MNGLSESWWIMLSRSKTNVLKSLIFCYYPTSPKIQGVSTRYAALSNFLKIKKKTIAHLRCFIMNRKKEKNLNIKETFPTISDITNM